MTGPIRTFSFDDQQWFRQVSGDANPIHVDPDWAKVNFPGELVVHGVHAVLWAVEQALADWPADGIARVQATFVKPILVGDVVTLEIAEDGRLLRLFVLGELMMRVCVDAGPARTDPPAGFNGDPTVSIKVRELQELKDLSASFPATVDTAELTRAFPRVVAALGLPMAAGLTRLSTLVGMECPGLRSMFSEFSVAAAPENLRPVLVYTVRRTSAIFGRAEIAVRGSGLSGQVVAYVGREAAALTDAEIAASVRPGAFTGSRPLIVGGSGGLGATTARMLAAGGARPILTWHSAQAAAHDLCVQIATAGGQADTIRFDTGDPATGMATLAAAGWDGDQVYYFATPRIFRRNLGGYQPAALKLFIDIYVDRFAELIEVLAAGRNGRELTVFYPSTVAIDENTPDLLEYAMAKEAGERLCRALEQRYAGLRVVVARLPRIDTRQTQSFVAQAASPPHLAMQPWLTRVQGADQDA